MRIVTFIFNLIVAFLTAFAAIGPIWTELMKDMLQISDQDPDLWVLFLETFGAIAMVVTVVLGIISMIKYQRKRGFYLVAQFIILFINLACNTAGFVWLWFIYHEGAALETVFSRSVIFTTLYGSIYLFTFLGFLFGMITFARTKKAII